MKKLITATFVLIFILSTSVLGQPAAGTCTDNGTLKNSGATEVFLFYDIINCDNGNVIINDAGGDGELQFDRDVTLQNLTINFQNGNKPIKILIPSGVTVTITDNLIFGGMPNKDKFLIVEGTLIVGNTLDFGGIEFEIDGLGSISADSIVGGGSTTCSGSGTCPTISAKSCTDGGICNDSNFTLPIELKSFTASIKFDNVQLDWVTAKEENFSHFEVERTIDNINYEAIAFVQGLGESLSDIKYEFTDDNAPYGVIYYRLKSVDNDGSFEYSWIISVKKSLEGKVNVSPNPANAVENIKINLPSPFDGRIAMVGVYDLNGTLLQKLVDVDASEPLNINSNLKAGMYLIKIQHNGLVENIRLLIR